MGDEGGSPKKKVDTEALNKRLFYQANEKKKTWEEKRMKELEANQTKLLTIGKDKKMNQEEMSKMLENVYTMQMTKAKQKQEKNLKILEEGAKKGHKPTSTSDTAEMVQRMYNMEIEKRKAKSANLERKYQPPPEKKKLDSDKTKEVNSRLYESTKGKKDQIREALYQKYNGDDLPKTRKLNKEEQASMAQRLAEKK